MTYNAQLAGETLGHLVALGVKDFVICAGARNAPLVTSLLAVEAKNELRVFHHFDERSAAFFALGLALASDATLRGQSVGPTSRWSRPANGDWSSC